MSSQFGQDFFVLEVLQGLRGGFFLDSGAADGVSSSNTLLLEKAFEWSGICVEPNSGLFARLLRSRKCQCVNCCLYNSDGIVDFVESANMLGGILEEYPPEHLQYTERVLCLPKSPTGLPATVRKRARTIGSILREYGAPRIIDYWSLDTEGSELAILRSFPYDEYCFRVLTVEHNHYSSRDLIRRTLEYHGYRRIRSLEIDDCYVREELMPTNSRRSSVWTRVGRAIPPGDTR